MTTPFNSGKLFDELVFENRNKEYGAYAIRRSYNDTMTRSLLIALGIVTTIVAVAMLFGNNKPDKVEIPVIPIYDTLIMNTRLPDEPEQPKIPEKQEPTAAQPKSENPLYTPSDDQQQQDIKLTDQTKPVNGDPNSKLPADSTTSDPPVTHGEIKVEKTPPPPVQFVDVMPAFPDMQRFIQKNLMYPAMAKENGTSGIVVISFVVELDGSVSNIQVTRGIGDGCEQEAMRVVSLMKGWTPGILKGLPQRTLLNLPIRFSLK